MGALKEYPQLYIFSIIKQTDPQETRRDHERKQEKKTYLNTEEALNDRFAISNDWTKIRMSKDNIYVYDNGNVPNGNIMFSSPYN